MHKYSKWYFPFYLKNLLFRYHFHMKVQESTTVTFLAIIASWMQLNFQVRLHFPPWVFITMMTYKNTTTAKTVSILKAAHPSQKCLSQVVLLYPDISNFKF